MQQKLKTLIWPLFRLILVLKPLHYRRMVTKTKIHIGFSIACSFLVIEITTVYIFFRQDQYLSYSECYTVYILNKDSHAVVYLCTFVTSLIIMLVNCIVITVKLRKRGSTFVKQTLNGDVNLKMTRTCWLVATSFLICYLPCTTFTIVLRFIPEPYPEPITYLLLDTSYLLYNVNNAINPFIYFTTLKPFRANYKNMLMCKKMNVTKAKRKSIDKSVISSLSTNFKSTDLNSTLM